MKMRALWKFIAGTERALCGHWAGTVDSLGGTAKRQKVVEFQICETIRPHFALRRASTHTNTNTNTNTHGLNDELQINGFSDGKPSEMICRQ